MSVKWLSVLRTVRPDLAALAESLDAAGGVKDGPEASASSSSSSSSSSSDSGSGSSSSSSSESDEEEEKRKKRQKRLDEGLAGKRELVS